MVAWSSKENDDLQRGCTAARWLALVSVMVLLKMELVAAMPN